MPYLLVTPHLQGTMSHLSGQTNAKGCRAAWRGCWRGCWRAGSQVLTFKCLHTPSLATRPELQNAKAIIRAFYAADADKSGLVGLNGA